MPSSGYALIVVHELDIPLVNYSALKFGRLLPFLSTCTGTVLFSSYERW